MPFPFYKQFDAMDCGPTCLRMAAKYYGKSYTLSSLRNKSSISKSGVSLLGISQAAEEIGFKTLPVQLPYEKLITEAPLPCIIHWRQDHFVVIYKIKKNTIFIADPAKGRISYNKKEFLDNWLSIQSNGNSEGIALLLEPTAKFYESEDEPASRLGFSILFRYLLSYKKFLFQLILGLFIGSVLQLIFPFLTQSIVDVGIDTHNLNFIYLVLIAEIMLFLGRTSVEFIRNWILLHISTRINISILSDFLIKLMKLPLSFFDTKMFGDIMQRIDDHRRIQNFLTGTTLNTLFSLISLVVFFIVLAIYNIPIFLLFLAGSILYMLWIAAFLKRRRTLDYKHFDIAAKNQSTIIQLIHGMQEIKLNNCEREKRWEWEYLQGRLFRVNIKELALTQYQQAGAFFLNEGKNILITFLSAKAVLDGTLTLGQMLAIQYIIGQLNSPIDQLIQFIQTTQDAKISIDRLNEIHVLEDEESPSPAIPVGEGVRVGLPEKRSLLINNLGFQYPGAGNEPVLKNINLTIPQGKVTAIVGTSGSGKTTLLKLLLKFYQPSYGEILIGETLLNNISHHLWRSKCGVVMQDGFIFSDTIAGNIAVGDSNPDKDRLLYAANMANIQSFIESLPLGYNTKIGAEGNGISQGQRQRILIARAIYKEPEFIFLDEATNALDANTERVIVENLHEFFKGRTVIVVAHRLSTVSNADQIVVMNKGMITEFGTHSRLTGIKGEYYHLVKNQLELGN